MGSIYEARWNHALKFATKVNGMITRGYAVFDQYDKTINCFEIDNYEIAIKYPTYRVILICNDKEIDEGLYETEEEFKNNRGLYDWKYILPKNMHKFFKRKPA